MLLKEVRDEGAFISILLSGYLMLLRSRQTVGRVIDDIVWIQSDDRIIHKEESIYDGERGGDPAAMERIDGAVP